MNEAYSVKTECGSLDFSDAELESLRADFPILSLAGRDGRPLAYLDSTATSQKPQIVLDTMREFYEKHNGAVHRGTHQLGDEATELFENARGTVARFLGAREDEIVWTSGATAALNTVAYAFSSATAEGGPEVFSLREGDEIAVSRAEHHANLVPWQLVANRTGARVRPIELTEEGRIDTSRLAQAITNRTRVVAVTHLSNVTGAITDLKPVVEQARTVGALIVLDTCQSGAHLDLNLQTLGVDFACFSGHKMCGPTGIGALWGRAELLAQMPVFLSGGSMIEDVSLETGTTFLPAPYRFEAGTQPVAQIVGWAAACDYLSKVGMERVAAHEAALSAYALPRLAEIPGIKVLGPPASDSRAGVLSFALAGVHPHDLGQYLDSLSIAVRVGHHCAIPLHRFFDVTASTRATFSLTTTRAEVDRLLEGLPQAAKFFGAGE